VEMAHAGRGGTDQAWLLEMAGLAVTDAVGCVAVVEVGVVRDPPWSPAMIDEIAAADL
jgi:hypothetical protein